MGSQRIYIFRQKAFMKLSIKQKDILYGLILGDGYLQKTGQKNARLRLEHSHKQENYINWKFEELKNLFSSRPKRIERLHPISKKKYIYYRLQSNSSSLIGKLQGMFYQHNKRVIPEKISNLLKSPLTLAVWYMDDGYYYKRDKSAHIYLPKYQPAELELLRRTLASNFGIKTKFYCRPDKKSCQINIIGEEKEKFFSLISPHIIKSLRYKITPDPVTTESEN